MESSNFQGLSSKRRQRKLLALRMETGLFLLRAKVLVLVGETSLLKTGMIFRLVVDHTSYA